MDVATPTAHYVARNGQVYCPPFKLEHLRLYGFVLPADRDCLQRNVCDRFFNIPSHGTERFRPVAPYVLLAFSHIRAIRSQTPPYSRYGYFPEEELGFWVLMMDEKRARLCWTIPYIFVNNSIAIASGREIYGFPKQMGELKIPTDPAQADLLSADTLLLEEYGPDSCGQIARIVEARRTGPAPAEMNQLKSLAEILWSLMKVMGVQEHLMEDLRLALHSADDMAHLRIPLVFLKQFRDCGNDNLACYQSIVEAPLRALHSYAMAWLPSYEITINSYAGLPLHNDLGLQAGPIQPVLSFTTESDNEIGTGVELWNCKA